VPVQLPLLPLLYGLDIETDTTVNGLDPSVSSVVAVSLATDDDTITFTGPEPQLLRSLDRHLRRLPAGVLVTWNGSGFDLPFLHDRARAVRRSLALRLTPDPALPHKYAPLIGHEAPYRATWHGHGHVDACCVYRTLLPEGTSCALKSVAREAGLGVVEEDRERLHEIGAGALVRYAASDAELARLLLARVWLDAGTALLDAA
jgi:DNA polymerase elongation subunit (family B)